MTRQRQCGLDKRFLLVNLSMCLTRIVFARTLPSFVGTGRLSSLTFDGTTTIGSRHSLQRISNRRRNISLSFATCYSSTTPSSTARRSTMEDEPFFAQTSFSDMGIRSTVLLQRLAQLGLDRPTAVQAAAFVEIASGNQNDITVGAETGTGKTLSYLLPLLDDILEQKQQRYEGKIENEGVGDQWSSMDDSMYDYARAIILVPNKELVQQVVRMALPLAGGPSSLVYGGNTLTRDMMTKLVSTEKSKLQPPDHELVRLAIMPGGLDQPIDFPPFRNAVGLGGTEPPVDLVITTPASLGPLGLSPKNIDLFADVQTLVVDEADMLLDGGYLRPLENVLMGFRRADRLDPATLGYRKTQHVFVAATIPDYGLRSVDAYLQKKFPDAVRVTMAGMHNALHYGLADQTEWMFLESKKERMQKLVELLGKATQDGGLKDEKVMVFLNSVEDADAACEALSREGHLALPYHAKIKLDDRTQTLDRFRRYQRDSRDENGDAVPILVCTDLASRGLDVPGVNAVVQLQFAGNVVSHLHRMGRCGRAGIRSGRGIVFYDEEKRELVEVIRQAEATQDRMVLEGDVLEVDSKDGEIPSGGSVQKAFSRRRGFTKKLKKLRKEGGANN